MNQITITDLRTLIAGVGSNAMIIYKDQHYNPETLELLIAQKGITAFSVDDVRVYNKSTHEYAVITPSTQGTTTPTPTPPTGTVTLPASALVVTSNGQTRWNVGTSETRTTLYFNGERMVPGVHYSINLPFLDWLSPVPIDTTDILILTV